MADQNAFDLSRFLADEDRPIEIKVFVPKGVFRIHPNEDRMAGPVYMSYAGNEWRLVGRDVVNSYRVPYLWQAELYEGTLPDGTTFILPLTYPKPGCEGWFNTLQQAISLARTQWVSIEADREEMCYVITPDGKKMQKPLEWMDCGIADLVGAAFFDRMVLTVKEAEKCFPKKQPRRIHQEEFEE